MQIRRIKWQKTIALRHAVLWPDKEPEQCHLEGDEAAWHFGAFVPRGLVSVASVFPEGEKARLRKFATLPEYQGKGIGTKMLNHILTELSTKNVSVFWCDARESAMGFYSRFGMTLDGDRFYKDEVPYFKMSVQLS